MSWTVDTNVLVDALRTPADLDSLKIFLLDGHEVWISSVVVAEIVSGARSPRAKSQLEAGLVAKLIDSGRVLPPDDAEWRAAGRLLADHAGWAHTAGLQNDVLLAVQATRRKWRVITRDGDFREIAKYLPGLAVHAPFPGRRM